MDKTYWHKQTKDKPLFEDLLWSRPENKRTAGKLLIIGGNSHGFAAPAQAYGESIEAGIGLTRVLLPLSVKSMAGKLLETVDYAPSTLSGSFSTQALAEWLDHSTWADGVLLAGDLGRNSETAILLEKYLGKTDAQVTLTGDAADYVISTPETTIKRPKTLMVLTLAQLQKLYVGAHREQAITSGMDLLHLIDMLHDLTKDLGVAIITNHLQQIVVAYGGQVSTTPNLESSSVKIAAHAAVWWLQNPGKPFEAITTSLAT
jgi:hypothetical protein